MKKIKIETKIAIGLTLIVLGIALIIGVILVFGIGGEFFYGIIDGFNGGDLEILASCIGLFLLPVLILSFIAYTICGSSIFIAAIWLIYGITKLIQKAINKRKIIASSQDISNEKTIPTSLKKDLNKKTIIVSSLCIIVILIVIASFVNINIAMDTYPEYAKEKTIGALAYNYCEEENTVYIKEYGKYEPYLVLHNNDYEEGSTLLLRKNVLGGNSEYIDGMFGEKIPKEYIYMEPYNRYENSSLDTYLQNDFQNRFDNNILEIINNTEISLCASTGSDGEILKMEEEYYINRKFFVLSLDEIFNKKDLSKYYKKTCNNSDNDKELKYFSKNRDNLITFNDAGEPASWWVRNYDITYYYLITSSGIIGMGYEEIGIRPAFTINSSINFKEVYNEEIGNNIYILDI